MIKLQGIPPSRALRSIWAIEEVGVEYELVPTHVIRDAKKPEYLAFTLADLNVAGVLSMATFVGFGFSGFANVKRWFDACTARPAFARAGSR